MLHVVPSLEELMFVRTPKNTNALEDGVLYAFAKVPFQYILVISPIAA